MYMPSLENLFGQGQNEGDARREWKNLLGFGALRDLGIADWGESETETAARDALNAETADRLAAQAQAAALTRQGVSAIQGGAQSAAGALAGANQAGLHQMDYNYEQARRQLEQSGRNQLDTLSQGYGQGANALGQGFMAARNTYEGMAPAWNALGQDRLGDISSAGLAAGYQRSPGYDFQLQQARNSVLAQAAAAGGRGGGNTLTALSDVGQRVSGNDWNAYANRALQAKQIQLGALSQQGAMQDAATQAQAQGLAQAFQQGGQSIASMYGQAAEAYARQQGALGSGLAGLSQQYGSQLLSDQLARGTQLANLYGTTGSNIAAALTGQGQMGANLATGIDRSALVATAGGADEARAGGIRDLAQLAILQGMSGRRY